MTSINGQKGRKTLLSYGLYTNQYEMSIDIDEFPLSEYNEFYLSDSDHLLEFGCWLLRCDECDENEMDILLDSLYVVNREHLFQRIKEWVIERKEDAFWYWLNRRRS